MSKYQEIRCEWLSENTESLWDDEDVKSQNEQAYSCNEREWEVRYRLN